jgi:hypothetical protein
MKLYPSLVAKLGAVPAIVLSQIFYWNDGRLRVKRKGAWWLAKSRAEMCKETGLSLHQQKRAITFLKRYGWIIVERGLFNNRITPHIQLTKKGRLLFEETIASKPTSWSEAGGADPLEATDANPLVQNDANPITVTTAVNTAATTAVGDYVAKSKSKTQKELSQGEEEKKKMMMVKVENKVIAMDSKEMLAKLKEKKLPAADGPKNAAGLALAWQKLVPYYHDLPVLPGGLKIKPLTQKEIGMLAMFLKAVGKDEAYVTLHWSIQNWHLLSISVKEQKGGMLPTVPGVNYLLRYYDVAIGCYKKQQQSPAKANSGPKLVSEAEQKSKLLVGK